MHSFLGLAGYYRKLINPFAQREAPLRRLLNNQKVTERFRMGDEEIKAFNDLRTALMSDPVLALPDFSGKSKFELHTDASDLGISAILVQIGPDGIERVVQYGSRMLTKAELKWHTQEKEALAIVWGCLKFRAYLVGSHFTIRTDHHSLQWLLRSDKGRLSRWAVSLSEFDYTIVYRPGKENVNADVASRWTTTPAEEWDSFPHYADPTDKPAMMTGNDKTVMVTKLTPTKRPVDLVKLVTIAQINSELISKVKSLISKDKDLALEALGKTYVTADFVKVQLYENYVVRVVKDKHGSGIKQILVPSDAIDLQKQVMMYCHDAEFAGHFGAARTLNRVLANYYWPSVRKYVKEYYKSCHSCQVH